MWDVGATVLAKKWGVRADKDKQRNQWKSPLLKKTQSRTLI